jgi:hypothetical protein
MGSPIQAPCLQLYIVVRLTSNLVATSAALNRGQHRAGEGSSGDDFGMLGFLSEIT